MRSPGLASSEAGATSALHAVSSKKRRAQSKSGGNVSERESSTWFKISNLEYSQMVSREELFERERHKEPVAGLALLRCGGCWARTP